MTTHTRRLAAFGIAVITFLGFGAKLSAEITLTGPQIVKLDWGTRALQVADINGDGLNDILVANNDRATIEILYQLKPGEPLPRVPASLSANRWEPVVEDARFRKATITTGVNMFDLAVGDLNGDGRPDLVYTGAPQALTIRYQQDDGSWTEKKIPEAPQPNQLVGSLKIADLDKDGRQDLVMLGLKELAVFYQQKDGTLAAPERYTLPDDNCYGLEICDVNGDGLPDLVYLCNGPRQTMRVRLQTSARQFGPELSYEIKNSRCTLQVLQQAKAASADGKTPAQPAIFAFAQDGTGQLEEFALRQTGSPTETQTTNSKTQSTDAVGSLRPRVFSPRPGAKTAAAYAFGHFTTTKPGKPLDIVVSDPDGAQVFLYTRQPDGGFTSAQKSPVFSDARCLAAGDWDGDGQDDLFVGSPKEQAVGVARYNEGRFEYPRPLPITGKPLALAFGDFDGKGRKLLVVLREEKGKRTLELWQRKGDSAENVRTLEITGLKTDPRAIRLVDANQDGKLDIAVFTPLDTMRLYVQGEDLNFTEASAGAGFRRGLVDNLEYSALTLGDINGDGKLEMLASSSGFARALKLGPDGLVVLDQYNARDPNADIATAFALPAPKIPIGATDEWLKSKMGASAKANERKSQIAIVLYDRKSEQFQILRPDSQGLYQVSDTTPAGKIDVTGVEVLPATATTNAEAFIFGKDRFWWLPLGQSDFSVTTLSTHTTDLPDVNYADVIAGDLDGDGKLELICVDPMKNLLEILHRGADNRWESVMHFKVFEIDQHFQGRRGTPLEPRETVIADVTGTGKKSVILLVHDRVLIYPAQ